MTNLAGKAAHAASQAELRERLYAAIKGSFPPNGERVPAAESTESPTLTAE
jgi:hypothetical protein